MAKKQTHAVLVAAHVAPAQTHVVFVAPASPAVQQFPRAVYFLEPAGAKRTHIVQSQAEHDALGPGWE